MAAVTAACSQASTSKTAAAAGAAVKPLLQLLYNVAMTWLWPLFTASSQGYECLQRVLKDGALSLNAVSDSPHIFLDMLRTQLCLIQIVMLLRLMPN
jgi:hypothetical protein